MEWLKKTWKGFKEWAYKYIGGLFMESKDGKLTISLGRVSFLGVLSVMGWFWIFKGEVKLPDGLFETFLTLAGYIFGTKITGAVKDRLGGK